MSIEIVNRSCLDYLKSPFCPYFDFAFSDPPFNIGQKYNDYNDSMPIEVYREFTSLWIVAVWNKIKPGAAFLIHGSISCSREIMRSIFALNLDSFIETEICWAYNFGQCNFNNFIETHCRAIVLRKPGNPRKWYVDQVLTESKRLLMGDKRVMDSLYGGYIPYGTVWGLDNVDGVILEPLTATPNWGRVQGNNSERRSWSPNQLPEKYVTRALRAYTTPGDLVFDPFAGSGTTAICCKKERRRCITTEISTINCEYIKQVLK